ncbi:hypothetical protein A2966_02920 [Candidatus Roizmanbacteria bacterium RIFCSPLOWO2_01_FULL_41_22]|uniref:Ferric oxidoreductase domain-containing protein n=2 Tax=Candidatus Roizmaniibacteriota TaxID=1752723 RepID=A0A1F7JQR6_9BACT|nr:MAG: hypothetical protein A2966_02920 [Candidatus Roizmanbacteria bacterium RIFCSPLOWO2_01_FULL_41_22]OGK57947.1 MAG: hypothetical protein A3H86_04180 [Candidatus Roizmanbacteria bacterium RIFCSPLOWO2_02_FULL_41_9]
MSKYTKDFHSVVKDRTPLKWSEAPYAYTVAFFFALVLFVIFSIYLFNRRGFYDLYIINKVFAGVAIFQLGIVLLMGPLCRMFYIFDHLLRFRKEFGIIAFFFAVLHSTSSLFLLKSYFPIEKYFTTERIPFTFGLMGILILIFIFLISNKKSMDIIGFKRWWIIQYWGVRAAFLVVALHVFVMKTPGWIDWYKKGGANALVHPEWPGLGLLEGWFIFFVILIRIAETININLGRLIWYISVPALPLIYFLTFSWGRKFLP